MATDSAKEEAKQFLAEFIEKHAGCQYRDAWAAAEAAGHQLSPVMWRWALRRRDTRVLQRRVDALHAVATLLKGVEPEYRARVLAAAATLSR